MTIRLGCVEYINALPFYYPLQKKIVNSDTQITCDIPSKLNNLLKAGIIDVALTSCVLYLDGDYGLLPGFGIAAEKKIMSVNFYIKSPLTEGRVGLTHHSATSISLLKVLCHRFWNIQPQFETLDRSKPFSNYAAILLIGNEALENPVIPGFQTIDLASAWYEATSLPFVFAVFSARQTIEKDKLLELQEQLKKALAWSYSEPEEIESVAAKQSALPRELIRDYYRLCRYHLGEKEIEGLNTFRELRNVSSNCT